MPKSRETGEESDHCQPGPARVGSMEGSSCERGGGWTVFEPQPLPDLSASSSCSRRNNVSLEDERHPFVQALIAMLGQVNEWHAGAAAGHSQCQAAKPAALGQPGPAGLGVLPTSAPRRGALQGDSGAEGSAEGGEGAGRLGGSQPLSEAYSSHPPSPPPSLLFFRLSASIRPLIRRKWL